MASANQKITELLVKWRQGEELALQELMPLVYSELRRLAHGFMRAERSGHSLETTGLVNEAYLRLVDSRRVHWQDRVHFLAVAAQLMRRVLVDLARAKRAQKRGGVGHRVMLEDALNVTEDQIPDFANLNWPHLII